MTEAWRPDDEDGSGAGPRAGQGPGARQGQPSPRGRGRCGRDGYHELNTVYHAISIYDELTARRGDTLTLTMEGEGTGELALDDTNLVIRAARALAGYAGVAPHARLHLRKQIPLAGGLAGGSADAAAALVACDALWGTGLSRDELAEHRRRPRLRRAVPVHGGTALGTGRGEAVSPVLARATPGTGWWRSPTAASPPPSVYRELDRLRDAGAAGEAARQHRRAARRAAPARPAGARRRARQRPAGRRADPAARRWPRR